MEKRRIEEKTEEEEEIKEKEWNKKWNRKKDKIENKVGRKTVWEGDKINKKKTRKKQSGEKYLSILINKIKCIIFFEIDWRSYIIVSLYRVLFDILIERSYN